MSSLFTKPKVCVCESERHLECVESAVLAAREHGELDSEQQRLQQLEGALVWPEVM